MGAPAAWALESTGQGGREGKSDGSENTEQAGPAAEANHVGCTSGGEAVLSEVSVLRWRSLFLLLYADRALGPLRVREICPKRVGRRHAHRAAVHRGQHQLFGHAGTSRFWGYWGGGAEPWAGTPVSQFTTRSESQTSFPGPPLVRSKPSPPARLSSPPWPQMRSSPPPPSILSFPSVPMMMSVAVGAPDNPVAGRGVLVADDRRRSSHAVGRVGLDVGSGNDPPGGDGTDQEHRRQRGAPCTCHVKPPRDAVHSSIDRAGGEVGDISLSRRFSPAP